MRLRWQGHIDNMNDKMSTPWTYCRSNKEGKTQEERFTVNGAEYGKNGDNRSETEGIRKRENGRIL